MIHNIRSLPNYEGISEHSRTTEILPSGQSDGLGGSSRYFEVTLDRPGEEPPKITLSVLQEPLPPGEQGDFFIVTSDEATGVNVAIETQLGSNPKNLIARAAFFALDQSSGQNS